MKLRRLAYVLASSSTLIAASGCSSDAGNNVGKEGPEQTPGTQIGEIGASLVQADNCDDLLERVRAQAIFKLKSYAEQLRDPEQYQGFPGRGGVLIGEDGAGAPNAPSGGGVAPVPMATPPSAPGMSGGVKGADPGSEGESPSGRDFSETNTQVAGVDEADIVKTDGNHLYLVHGTKLFVLDVRAKDATLIESQTTIEGQPLEMFIQDGIAVVFSSVSPTPELVGGQDKLDALYRFSDPSQTKMTVLDVTGQSPEVLREVYTQGSYVSSRRVDDVVRSVVRGPYRYYQYEGASIEYYNLFGERYEQSVIDAQVDAWLARKEAELGGAGLDYWLPTQHEKKGDKYVALPRDCGSHFIPAPGLTEPGATTVVTANLSDLAGPVESTTILGGADQVYSNAESLVIAHYDSRFHMDDESREQTALHHFALAGDTTSYTASGFIPGHILNQFSMDERGGVLRVATTENTREEMSDPMFPENRWFNFVPENRVYMAQADGSVLKVVGKTAKLGHEGETIHSTRFIGDVGYVVTFRQTDPLVVLDLRDATNPKVTGELEIPGFSSYLHPMGDGHLLAIGRDGGLQLQIFDVRDPANPKQAHKWTADGYSSAEGEHKAFNYYEKLSLLTFPFVRWGEFGSQSTLEVFRVDANGGFEQLASLDHSDMMRSSCEQRLAIEWGGAGGGMAAPGGAAPVPGDIATQCSYSVGEVKRGVFIDDLIYSISDAGVLAHDVANFAQASKLELPVPEYYGGGNYYGPFPGGVGIATPGPSGPVPVAAPSAGEPGDVVEAEAEPAQ